jgi:hypothetical protein
MLGKSAVLVVVVCALCLFAGLMACAQVVTEPPYVFLLRSRDGVVTPERSKHAETGGGFIHVTQVTPNVLMFWMHGAAAAGVDHAGSAGMQFKLEQDLEILATRAGIRPPRLVAAAWLIGSLDSTLRNGGMAEQAPACAAFRSIALPEPIVSMCIKPHSVGGGENLLVNERVGPLEAVVAPGPYHLSQTFAINVNQQKACYLTGSAAANFDPEPRLEGKWNDVLKPFRAVPKRDYGYRVILRVVEDVPPVEAPPPQTEALPPPQPVPQASEKTPVTPPVLNAEKRTP